MSVSTEIPPAVPSNWNEQCIGKYVETMNAPDIPYGKTIGTYVLVACVILSVFFNKYVQSNAFNTKCFINSVVMLVAGIFTIDYGAKAIPEIQFLNDNKELCEDNEVTMVRLSGSLNIILFLVFSLLFLGLLVNQFR